MSKCGECGEIVTMMYGGCCFPCAMDKKTLPKRKTNNENEYPLWLTWEETQIIIDMFDAHESRISEKLSNQLLKYAVAPK